MLLVVIKYIDGVLLGFNGNSQAVAMGNYSISDTYTVLPLQRSTFSNNTHTHTHTDMDVSNPCCFSDEMCLIRIIIKEQRNVREKLSVD